MKKILMFGEVLCMAAVLTSCGIAEAKNISPDKAAAAAIGSDVSSSSDETISGYPLPDEEAAAASEDTNRVEGTGDISHAAIDYGTSEIYTKEDMDAAIARIKKEFSTWKGCVLKSVNYTSDDCNSTENLKWMNELKKARTPDSDTEFTQCIAFKSNFHSPKNESEAGAFEPDEDISDWSWWLARTDGGEWHLMTWGY